MAKLSDTSPEAERNLTRVYRRQTPEQKWLRLDAMYRDARLLHAAGVRLRNPSATPRDVLTHWLTVNLGMKETRPSRQFSEPQPVQYLHETRDIVRTLERLGIPYALGGSMACAIHGIDRYPRVADFSVEPFPGREAEFAAAFGPDYYVSESAIQAAIRGRSSFNVINTATGFKADFFVRKDIPFEISAMDRRIAMSLPDEPGQPIAFHSAEDLILFKLRWYRLGNETSEQQWGDVLGILRTQGDRIDAAYLDHWATDLGVADLLSRVRKEVNLF